MTNRERPGRRRLSDVEKMRRLALQHQRNGQYLPALRIYDTLIRAGNADAAIWRETGNALTDVGEFAQAQDAFRECLCLDDADAEAHHHRARVLYRLGDLEGAQRHLRRAIALGDSLSSWLSLATIIPGCPGADHREVLEVRRQLAAKLAAVSPSPQTIVRRRRSPAAPLRIGYLSGYFHAANYMKPVWGLINHHDRQSVSLHLLNDSPPDALPGYQPHSADQQHDIRSLDNSALRDLLLRLDLDVVVDLNSYSVPERLGLFAAPLPMVGVAWFNAYATTGLPGIEYLIGDDEVIRDDEVPYYTETVVRLPLSYLTFEVEHAAPPVQPPPCLERGKVTFGSLVAQYKVTAPVLDAWSEILRRTPGSQLVLANTALKSPQNRAYVREQFRQRGVAGERLELLGPAEHYAYLQYYDRVDIALDAFPYNGGTTTMEALWQGVPVLTFHGDRWASRTSQTLIRRTPWGRFVADSSRAYVEQAVTLATAATTPGELAGMRPHMRELLRRSPACDTPRLAAAMESIFRELVAKKTDNPSAARELRPGHIPEPQ